MEICLKDTLRALRQKKNITQEALAQHLGITSQSVGKWERGEGYPDITLLPAIAAYFDVTIDDLLDVGAARKEEKYKSYQSESEKYKHEGLIEEEIALWERAYAEFPNDCRVMDHLMSAIVCRALYPMPDDDAERIYILGERILETSTDQKIRENTIHSLCITYGSRGETEKALKYADMGGNLHTVRENLRSYVIKGEEGIKECQTYLLQLLNQAAMIASQIAVKKELSAEEMVQSYRFGIDLLNLLFCDGNVGFYAFGIAWRYFSIACIYANKYRDKEKTLEALTSCVEYSVKSVQYEQQGARPYTAPLVNRLTDDPSEVTKNYTGNDCDTYYKKLSTWQNFDFLRDEPRFQALLNRLLEYAEEANHNN